MYLTMDFEYIYIYIVEMYNFDPSEYSQIYHNY